VRAEAGGEASAAGRLRRDAVGCASLLGRLTASLLLPRLFVFGSRRARARPGRPAVAAENHGPLGAEPLSFSNALARVEMPKLLVWSDGDLKLWALSRGQTNKSLCGVTVEASELCTRRRQRGVKVVGGRRRFQEGTQIRPYAA